MQCFKEFQLKVAANKDFGHSRTWILTYQICNTVVLDITNKTDLSFQQKFLSNLMRWCYKYNFIGSISAIELWHSLSLLQFAK